MPSTDADAALFRTVDWDDIGTRRLNPDARSVGLLLALGMLAVVFAYDYIVAPRELVAALHWDVTRTDWLFLISSILFVRYVLVPIYANRERTRTYASEFLHRPAGVLSLAFILVFAFFGIVGPEAVFDFTYAKYKYRFQPPIFATFDPSPIPFYNCAGEMSNGLCHGSWRYPFGTTYIGENMMKLLLYGMRIGMMIGLTAGTIMAVIATAVGTTAGYFGGWLDDVLMRYVDVQQTIPAIIVYILAATFFFGSSEGLSDGGMFAFVVVFGLLDWGGIARLIRSEALTRRSMGYVRAAKAAGASDLQVIRRHVIPNSTATLVTAVTRRIPLLILAQVALAFLELNRVNSMSLGRVMRIGFEGQHVPWYDQWWITVFGVVFLVLTVVSFSVFGDTLRDMLDTRAEVE